MLGNQGLDSSPEQLSWKNLGGEGVSADLFIPDRWDAATAEANVILGLTDRGTARSPLPAGLGCIRSINAIDNGQYYVEERPSNVSSMIQYSMGFGRASSFVNNNEAGLVVGSIGYRTSLGGQIALDGALQDSAPSTYSALFTVGLAIDFDAQVAWWHLNGVYQGTGTQDPNTGQGGFSFAGIGGSGPFVLWNGGDAWATALPGGPREMNYGQLPAVYDVPRGFTLGWPAS